MYQLRLYFEGRASRITEELDVEYERMETDIMVRPSCWARAAT